MLDKHRSGEMKMHDEGMRRRQMAAQLLVHTMTRDSWGVQEALVVSDGPASGFIDGFLSLYPLFWEAGDVLRACLTDAERDRIVEQLRREIVRISGTLGGGQ